MTPEELAEVKRANDLKEREVAALERIADKPVCRPARTLWGSICDDWEQTVRNSHRGC